MTNPSFAIAVTFRIKPEFIEAFRKRVLQQASDSVEREPGCHQFDVLVDPTDPEIVFLYETYSDGAAFGAHKLTPHFLDFDQQVSDWVASKKVRRMNLLENV